MIGPMASSPNLLDRLRALPAAAPLLAALDADRRVWVVGGTVRDLLLGGAPEDLDLVIEGDAVATARALGRSLGGAVTIHDRFGTATVAAGGHLYDLATARAETYAAPGALPDVRPARIEEDLLRRDFTVNAIAVALDGRVAAAPHALEDLEACVLRVLHDASFHDDPTRLLRLVRYATRLGFAAEPATEALASAALAAGALATVTPTRIGAELRLLLREPAALAALAWIAGWEGAPLGVSLAVEAPVVARALTLLPEDGRRDLLLLGHAVRATPPTALAAWLDLLGFPARDRDTVAACARAGDLAARLTAAGRPSAVAAAVRGAPLEAVALAGALGEAGAPAEVAARTWLADLRHVRLAIDGADLLAAGVPQGEAVGRALAAARDARLDGTAPDRETQLAAALRAVG